MVEDILPYLTIIKWIIPCIILLIGSISIFRKLHDKKLLETVTKSNRGTRTERELVLKLLKQGIPSQAIFHDLYIKKT
jgi:cytochrome c-type biogenesis protein CcmH/NrfF